MFNPEQFLRNLSERQEKRKTLNNKEYLQELSIKAQQMNNINRIDPYQFINLYGREAVMADLKWVKSRQAYFRTHDSETETWHKEVANILEAILHEQIEQNDYFGENVWTIKTCDYDDYRNHIDSLLEIRHPERRFANYSGLALDVTSASRLEALAKKIERIFNHIKRGQLAKIKYFQSDFLNIRGEKSNIPLFVVGCDVHHTEELAKLWGDGRARILAEHPIQIALLYQITRQAQIYWDYAKRNNQKEVADQYEEILKEFEAITQERQTIITDIKNRPESKEFLQTDIMLNNLEKILSEYDKYYQRPRSTTFYSRGK
ncbi:MAG TPA: hypothetical protein P5194_01690 [Patescibacteria group bacterium]|nr:hypothetical protein [bacterium]HRT11232.1 hypothetical protein [Patescibacteria group bacterium]HRU90027.1 hypothetical protein [Patescibacteria group bacterium]